MTYGCVCVESTVVHVHDCRVNSGSAFAGNYPKLFSLPVQFSCYPDTKPQSYCEIRAKSVGGLCMGPLGGARIHIIMYNNIMVRV